MNKIKKEIENRGYKTTPYKEAVRCGDSWNPATRSYDDVYTYTPSFKVIEIDRLPYPEEGYVQAQYLPSRGEFEIEYQKFSDDRRGSGEWTEKKGEFLTSQNFLELLDKLKEIKLSRKREEKERAEEARKKQEEREASFLEDDGMYD